MFLKYCPWACKIEILLSKNGEAFKKIRLKIDSFSFTLKDFWPGTPTN